MRSCLHSDRRSIEQFCLMDLGQAGSSNRFIVKLFKKLIWAFVEVFLEESIHLLQTKT